ncbi:C40 family peptidase [Sphingobacterium shayense]|uniref:C40 family peptidase n=1 Tax=Sphingobacterium shayense TaxID=626343 RepID=UPI0015532AA8|nr:C40 family peptidase [Sphingobacterium shayense]NQD71914.1 C40 family peptidase [Sphingobacterium shayense]
MKIAVCNLTIVALRSAASHRSEMVSQLLFGERFEIIENQSDWAFVRLLDVSYEGWVQQGQFFTLDSESVIRHPNVGFQVVNITGAKANVNERNTIALLPSTLVPEISPIGNGHFPFVITGDLRTAISSDIEVELPKLINYYVDSPYLWGGRSHLGIDCSGLSQAIYRHFGVKLPRDAYQQAEVGTVVDFLTEIRTGDLAFFDNQEGRITHVGIMIDNESIIHASAKVRIDRMDSEGIFNNDLNRYTHKLRIVKRYF